MVIAERIFDFVRDGQMRNPQDTRLPKLDDPRAQQRLIALEVAFADQGFPGGEQVLDRARRIENASPLHLRGMRRKHRRDET